MNVISYKRWTMITYCAPINFLVVATVVAAVVVVVGKMHRWIKDSSDVIIHVSFPQNLTHQLFTPKCLLLFFTIKETCWHTFFNVLIFVWKNLSRWLSHHVSRFPAKYLLLYEVVWLNVWFELKTTNNIFDILVKKKSHFFEYLWS